MSTVDMDFYFIHYYFFQDLFLVAYFKKKTKNIATFVGVSVGCSGGNY